jgi:thiol:disulfide interchange protein
VVLGTAASWYMGIVYFNGDMAFTLLNVISHGIPYMALVWMYGKKTVRQQPVKAGKLMRQVFSKYGLLLFLGIIFLLAYIEEGLWDVALWQQHRNVFGLFNLMDKKPADVVLAILVPLLALPQVTHYIIDGFIWRINKNDLEWANQT